MIKDFKKSYNCIINGKFGSRFINLNYEIKFMKIEEFWIEDKIKPSFKSCIP